MHSPFDRLILQAWARVQPQLLKNRDELERRLKRSKSRTFSSPPRAWCLAVRACDRRIGIRNGLIEPEHAFDPHDPSHPGRLLQHTVTLTAELVRDLCCPVTLTPGGELSEEAAKRLGTAPRALIHARISGALQTRHVKGLLGRRGWPVPIVSTSSLLDPSAGRNFQVPHPLWIGNEYVSARVPSGFSQTLTRIPIYASIVSRHQYDPSAHPELANPPRQIRKRLPPPAPDYVWYKWSKSGEFLGEDPRHWRKSPQDPGHPPPPGSEKPKRKRAAKPRPSRAAGSLQFRGWRWICPKCGKKVRTVYLPAPPECVLKDEFRRMKADEKTQNRLANIASSFRLPPSSFACATCHRIRGFSTIAPNSWNELVSYYTSGLLYGDDIPKPDWFTQTIQRKHGYRPRIRAAPRRQRLRELVLSGQTSRQIASEMGLTQLDVCGRIWQLCRDEHVPNRIALAKKYGVSDRLPLGRVEHARLRRTRVRELLIEGRSDQQIASEVNVSREIIWHDVHFLCREAGVKGRKALISQPLIAST